MGEGQQGEKNSNIDGGICHRSKGALGTEKISEPDNREITADLNLKAKTIQLLRSWNQWQNTHLLNTQCM